MVINDALKNGSQLLKKVSDVPLLEARILLEHALSCDRLSLIKKGGTEIDPDDAERFMLLVSQRLSGRPISYITGHKEFMGLDFYVNENVLIPRPDTETLAEYAIGTGKRRILDIGTGSGALAVSLAKLVEGSLVSAVDISPRALSVAEKNARENGAAVRFSRLDILSEKIPGEYDLIVSNPPYIKDSVIPTLDTTVKDFEPLLALSGGDDGLKFYREITKKAPAALCDGGILAFEIGYDQGEAVSRIMAEGFKDIKIIKDLAGCDRVVAGEKKGL